MPHNKLVMQTKRLITLVLGLALILMSSCSDDVAMQIADNQLVDIQSEEQFNSEIASGVSFMFYHASWCTKCAAQRPAVETVSEEQTFSEVFFAEVEYEDFPDLVKAQNIPGFPTIVIYKDGSEQERFNGQGHTEEQLRVALDKALNK